ncbi:hypothetical protein SmJEL517_g01927 [Synchytrium microbalum]|uniref:Sugar phosphate transporter domain-containing protein n=1 Tax=Synchytrium microbalum TaxID=1806994 RepID=A0A507C7U1_9FUNG|nr:uncharacterized protein SmJEL517_g01927 [Synchytrium microbalum]TPX35672.1 hypothetical protein SmJEL517_g01927 [Synchytrium microbalum]
MSREASPTPPPYTSIESGKQYGLPSPLPSPNGQQSRRNSDELKRKRLDIEHGTVDALQDGSVWGNVTRAMDTPAGTMMIYFVCNLTITLCMYSWHWTLFVFCCYVDRSPSACGDCHLSHSLTLGLYPNAPPNTDSKIIMKLFRFNFPWILTSSHALASAIGSAVLIHGFKVLSPTSITNRREYMTLLLFSLLYTVNIAISNVSLSMVSLPFHQIVRSTNPAFTIIMEYVFMRKQHVAITYMSLIPVILGVALATYGEYEIKTWMGVVLTFLGVLLSAFKGLVTNILLVGSLNVQPIELLYRMSTLAFMQSVAMAYVSGEVAGYRIYVQTLLQKATYAEQMGGTSKELSLSSLYLALFFNAVLAFVLNIASFSANKKTSALSMTVAGNVKQVLSVFLSVWIFGYVITVPNGLGILVTLAGGLLYSSIVHLKNKGKSTKSQILKL